MIQFTMPEKVTYIINTLLENGYEAYAVGGCVRDTVLGRVPEDWDITTSAKPEEVKALFRRTLDTGIRHGTVTVMLDKDGFEVTTYRIDGEYEDSRHPKNVEFTSSLKEDLKRRDFTINAMAYNPQAGMVDMFDGIGDIRRKVIKCVGNPGARFDEDALRMLRAVRFAGQLGFRIEEATEKAISQKTDALKHISWERIRTELDKLLISQNPWMLKTASRTGMCQVVLPELDAMLLQEQNNPHHIYSVGDHALKAVQCMNEAYCGCRDYNKKLHSTLAWTMLLHDVGKPDTYTADENGIGHFYAHAKLGAQMARSILKRLRFDNDTIERASRLIYFHDYPFTLNLAAMRRAANKIGPDNMELLFLVKQMDIAAQSTAVWKEKNNQIEEAKRLYQEIVEKEQCLTIKDLAVKGGDLISLGIPRGPKVGEILAKLLDLVLEQPQRNTKKQLLLEAEALKNRL